MIHPLKASTSFDCDGCGHHASFHRFEAKEEEEAAKTRWREEEARRELDRQREARHERNLALAVEPRRAEEERARKRRRIEDVPGGGGAARGGGGGVGLGQGLELLSQQQPLQGKSMAIEAWAERQPRVYRRIDGNRAGNNECEPDLLEQEGLLQQALGEKRRGPNYEFGLMRKICGREYEDGIGGGGAEVVDLAAADNDDEGEEKGGGSEETMAPLVFFTKQTKKKTRRQK